MCFPMSDLSNIKPDVQNQPRKPEIRPEGHDHIACVLDQNIENLS
jgi:hypothetical protein